MSVMLYPQDTIVVPAQFSPPTREALPLRFTAHWKRMIS
jgi:hypothetical protein